MKLGKSKVWLFGIVLVSLTLVGCDESRIEPQTSLDIGEPFPAFKLKSTDGQTISSSKELHQKSYVVAVFATWCPPCKQELVALEKSVWQSMKDKNVAVLGINFGEESAEDISKFAQQNGITFPLLKDQTGAVRHQLGVESIPVSFVVGADGKIVGKHLGYTEESAAAIGKELLSSLSSGGGQ